MKKKEKKRKRVWIATYQYRWGVDEILIASETRMAEPRRVAGASFHDLFEYSRRTQEL